MPGSLLTDGMEQLLFLSPGEVRVMLKAILKKIRLNVLLAAGSVATVTGCAAPPSIGSASSHQYDTVRALITTDEDRTTLHASSGSGWEQSRADAQPADDQIAEYGDWAHVEIRTRENLRTINGRPGEFSSSSTRIIRRTGERR